MKQNNLSEALKALCPSDFTGAQAHDAACNLQAFMELLLEIDMEHGITCSKGAGVRS